MTHTGARAAMACLALVMLVTAARAQPDGRSSAESSGPDGSEPVARSDEPDMEPHAAAVGRVLFLLPGTDEATEAELREALLAQFALVEAELLFATDEHPGEPLGQRMADAQQRSLEHGTLAVFWIDAQQADRWLVHMMDSERDRIVVRAVDAGSERRGAAIEAVAVMARESTRALLEGGPLPDAPIEARARPVDPASPRPSAPPAPAPAPSLRSRPLRLVGAYGGSDIAGSLPFRHGVVLGLGWLGFEPLYLGAAYAFTRVMEVEDPENLVDFEIQPLPIAVHAGYRHRIGKASFDLELGLLVELLRSTPPAADPMRGVRPDERDTRAVVALAPRARGEFALLPMVGLFAAGGADVLVNNFQYIVDDSRSDPPVMRRLLRGRTIRPSFELGIAFYP